MKTNNDMLTTQHYTNRIYGVHWAVAFVAPAIALVCIIAGLLLISGCVGNKAEANAIKIEQSKKSTTAENVDAYGRVAAGAWDRLFKSGSENKK